MILFAHDHCTAQRFGKKSFTLVIDLKYRLTDKDESSFISWRIWDSVKRGN